MKRSWLLFILWLICFTVESSFSWRLGLVSIKPLLSWFLAGFVFFEAGFVLAMFFAFFLLAVLSSLSVPPFLPAIPVGVLFLGARFLKQPGLTDLAPIRPLLIFLLLVAGEFFVSMLRGVDYFLWDGFSLTFSFRLAVWMAQLLVGWFFVRKLSRLFKTNLRDY